MLGNLKQDCAKTQFYGPYLQIELPFNVGKCYG